MNPQGHKTRKPTRRGRLPLEKSVFSNLFLDEFTAAVLLRTPHAIGVETGFEVGDVQRVFARRYGLLHQYAAGLVKNRQLGVFFHHHVQYVRRRVGVGSYVNGVGGFVGGRAMIILVQNETAIIYPKRAADLAFAVEQVFEVVTRARYKEYADGVNDSTFIVAVTDGKFEFRPVFYGSAVNLFHASNHFPFAVSRRVNCKGDRIERFVCR